MEEATENITREEIDVFTKIQKKIRSLAESIKDKYCSIYDIQYAKYLTFTYSTEGWLFFEGDEYWNYGGHEHHELSIPISYLYEKDWEDKERRQVQQRREEQEAEKNLRLLRESERIKEEELALLKELREKYEGQA